MTMVSARDGSVLSIKVSLDFYLSFFGYFIRELLLYYVGESLSAHFKVRVLNVS